MGGRNPSNNAVDAGTLANLRMIYKPGVQVEVVKVGGLVEGFKGIVKEVKGNGNITVLWNTGYETDVIFGMESVRAVVEGMCILKRKPENGGCDGDMCCDCGWNIRIAKQRIAEIRAGRMVKGKDGLYRLKVSQKTPISNAK